MLLEKIRQHAWKVLFLLAGVLMVMIGLVFNKQKNLEQVNANLAASEQDRINSEAAAESARVQTQAQAEQDAIAAYRQQQLDSIANNPVTVTKQEAVPVTIVVPGVTRKVTVPVASTSSSSSKSSSSSSKSTSTPAKSTKTS